MKMALETVKPPIPIMVIRMPLRRRSEISKEVRRSVKCSGPKVPASNRLLTGHSLGAAGAQETGVHRC